MSIVNESRPVASVHLSLGGSYAQPSGSEHASWLGQTGHQLNWAGERNAGQPLYAANDKQANPAEVKSRMRAMSGEVLDTWQRQHDADLKALGTKEDDVDVLLLQLYSTALST